MARDDEVDALFAAPLEAFVEQRNALAKKLKAGGDKEASEAIKSIAKPPVSAWAVNQLSRRNRGELEELIDAGEAVRKAQLALLAGKGTAAELREATEAHRAALASVTAAGDRILEEAGHALSATTTRRISTTLRAASTLEGGRDVLLGGRLTADVEAATFDALAGATLAPLGEIRAQAAAPEEEDEEAPEEEAPEEEEEDESPAEHRKAQAAARKKAAEEAKARKAAEAAARKKQEALARAREKLADLESTAKDLDHQATTAEREAARAAAAAEKARAAATTAREKADAQAKALADLEAE